MPNIQLNPKIIIHVFLVCTVLVGSISRSFSQKRYIIPFSYADIPAPAEPNYVDLNYWAALPSKLDDADFTPKGMIDGQALAKADVFYIYPTMYTKELQPGQAWNANITDAALNGAISQKAIKNQASIFNGSCKVYAPYYRQAHYSAFISADTLSAKAALELAYADVKMAFEYYLKNYNQGRPIVIAGHSQGTIMAKRILKDFFDQKPLEKSLVTAYLVGMPVNNNTFRNIKLSEKPDGIGGYTAWNTFSEGFYPTYYQNGYQQSDIINPISWIKTEDWVDKKAHKGLLGTKEYTQPKTVSAKIEKGILWIKKPDLRGKAFIKFKIWHFADYNLFWQDIRENVDLRVNSYFINNK